MLALHTHQPVVSLRRMAETPEKDEVLTEQQMLGRALRNLRKRADLTQGQAADNAGVEVVTWQRYEWGKRDLSFSQLQPLAEAVGATRDELLAELASVTSGPALRVLPSPQGGALQRRRLQIESVELPIRDRVQAGAWLQADDMSQQRPRKWPAAKDPRYAHADQWLSEVVGDSMNALEPAPIFEGDLVHCVDAIAINYAPKTGDVVEVERLRFQGAERELTIKQVEITADGALLWPRSRNPRWREPVIMADMRDGHDDVEVRVRGLVVSSIRRF
jgi:transcriptional regulator with XRE-family HTH domain